MLRILTLGGLQITLDNRPIAFKSRRAEVLFAYLAITQRAHERESLANLLWDDRSQKQTMANLRSLLAQMPGEIKPYLEATRKTLQLNSSGLRPSDLLIDAEKFATDLSSSPPLVVSLSLYKGDFLDGVFLTDSRGLEEWIAVTRERLRQLALTGHEQAARLALHERRFAEGIEHARAMVRIDPLRESAQHLLLRLLGRNQQFLDALTAYRAFESVLEDELGVRPMPKTQQLVQRIRQARLGLVHTVPDMPATLIGRESDLALISERLDDESCRLLTLLGTGGVGKTRLALQAAHYLRGDYLNGIVFVPLAGIVSAENTSSTSTSLTNTLTDVVANACGVTLSDQDALKQLCSYLRDKEMLLILDNCEHLNESVARLAETILNTTSHIKLLATSRERLWLEAEFVQSLSGLAYDGTDGAVALYVERSTRAGYPIELTGRALSHIQQLCALTEGLPLAIELAAASGLPPEEVMARIEQSLDAFTNRMRSTPARHASLRAVFDYSRALLDSRLQLKLGQLALMRNAFDLETAREVAQATASDLAQLIAKSLLRRRNETHYDLHPVVRQFATEMLASSQSTWQTAQTHYTNHFAHWLDARLQPLLGAEQPDTIKQVLAVRDDVLQAGLWSVLISAEINLPRTIEPIFHFFAIRARFAEGMAYFDQWLEHLNANTPTGSHAAAQTIMRSRWAWFAIRHGNYDDAESTLTSLLHQVEHSDSDNHAFCLLSLSEIARYRGNIDRSRHLAKRAEHVVADKGQREHAANAQLLLGRIEQDSGSYQKAQQHYESGLRHFEELGNPQQLAYAINSVGSLAGSLGDYATARQAFERAQHVAEAVGDMMGQVRAIMNLSTLAFIDNEFELARRLRIQGLEICQDIGYEWGVASALKGLGDVMRKLDDTTAAQRYYMDSLAMWKRIDDQRSVALTNHSLGNFMFEQGRLADAWRLQQAAITSSLKIDALPIALASLLSCADILQQVDCNAEALPIYLFVLAHPACEQQMRPAAEKGAEQLMANVGEAKRQSLQQRAEQLSQQSSGLELMVKRVSIAKPNFANVS